MGPKMCDLCKQEIVSEMLTYVKTGKPVRCYRCACDDGTWW